MEQERLKEGDVILGQPLPWNVFDRHGTLLLRMGYRIEDQGQLDALMARGMYLNANQALGPVDETGSRISPFELVDQVTGKLERLLHRIHIEEDFQGRVLELTRVLQHICAHAPDAALASIFLGSKNRYSSVHPVHATIVCEIVAKRSNLPQAERLPILGAALTMNVAMIKLQDALYHQKEPLSPAQREELRQHPARGVDMLRNAGVKDKIWLDAVLQHHERINGSGYPQGLEGEAVSMGARLISLGDTYTALVSGRAYRPPMLPNLAMRELFLSRGKLTDPAYVELFIKELGMYPPGTYVRLINGEIAMVTRHGVDARSPIVHSLVGPRGAPMAVPLRRDCGKDVLQVKEALSPSEANVRINPDQLWSRILKP